MTFAICNRLHFQSIVLTAILALIIIYHYAIIGHLHFPAHFDVGEDDNTNTGCVIECRQAF